uniref:Uncharacterized protein n=1 Tax=Arundo donax TaxID=35708 RepID=A0A0A9DKC9_ARUDO
MATHQIWALGLATGHMKSFKLCGRKFRVGQKIILLGQRKIVTRCKKTQDYYVGCSRASSSAPP